MQFFNFLASTPFEILGKWDTGHGSGTNDFMTELGFRELAYTLDVLGVWSAIFVILCAFVVLLVVNYPKTVSQTKTRIVHTILVVAAIGALPYFFDALGGLINELILQPAVVVH